MKLMKTVVLLVLSVAAADFAVAGGASRMYVQRGLVAQYDGIDNAGTGSHDSSAATWKNLAGDSSLDGTCASQLSWNGVNGWSVSGDCKPVSVGSGLAAAIGAGSFTVQFAVKPTMSNKRECFFGQYKESDGISIEHNASGVTSGYLRWFRNSGTLNSASANKPFSDVKILAGKFASASAVFDKTSSTETHTFRVIGDDGDVSQSSTSPKLGSLSSTCESVIGGEVQRTGRTDSNYTSGYGITFQGTYYAFRVYNVALTAVEVAWNAGLDAVRFNGADAATVLGPEYSYDAATDTLTTDATYYAPKPGTDAADGLKFDISFTGDTTADGITFSPTDAEIKQSYETADVPLPVLPAITNAATSCIYLPQSLTETNTIFRQDARKSGVAVTGQVATVFCRFRWDGSVFPAEVNYPAIIMNGYTSWNAYPNQGFCLRMRVEKNATRGYFSLIVPNLAVPYNSAGITTTGPAYVNAGRWVDMFVSVYPSPTNPKLSNADIWYCEVPSWNTSGYFNRTEIGHKHFGDDCEIPRMNTTTQKTVIFGSEPNAATYAITSVNGVKCLRGAIAAAKGWDRVLSENEMWTVMADLGGVQSFTDLETSAGRTFTTCNLNEDKFTQARNGTATSFLGASTENSLRWRAMTTTYNYNTLIWNAPKDDTKTYPVVYSTKISNIASGKTHPIHLEVNGTKVWPTDADSKDVAKGEEIKVEISEELTLPGLNELKWVYDTTTASNWIIFDHHKLKLVKHSGMIIILR